MPRAAARENVREEILRTAGALFHERGYDGTSMKDIADRVGVTAAGLYWHFDSKEAILVTYLESELERLVSAGQEALSSDDPEDQLREFTRRHVVFQIEHTDTTVVFESMVYGANQLRRAMPEDQARLIELERAHFNTLRNILDAGISRGTFAIENTNVAAFAIIGMGEHVIHWYRPEGGLTIEEIAEQFAEFAVRLVSPAG